MGGWIDGWMDGCSSLIYHYVFQVWNVIDLEVGDVSFDIHNDHSKWAVSDDTAKPWICIGDINRQVCIGHYQGCCRDRRDQY